MRHQWLVIAPKSRESWNLLPDRVDRTLKKTLTFAPETIVINKLESFSVLCSAFTNAALYGYEPATFGKASFCVTAGFPTLEKLSPVLSQGRTIEIIEKLVSNGEATRLFEELGGCWNVGFSSSSQISVFSSFEGYFSCYYANTPDFFIVGNKARSLATFLAAGRSPKLNYDALSWIPATTMIHGNDTAFAGIQKIPPGYICSYSSQELKVEPLPSKLFEPLDLSDTEKEEFLLASIDTLAARIQWLRRRNLRIKAHCTGGKDTRTILALLCGSGNADIIESIETNGSEENGDVIVARQVVKSLGLGDRHVVSEGSKGKATPPTEDIVDKFLLCAHRYDGQLTPFDGAMRSTQSLPQTIAFMGGGGEIYRSSARLSKKCPDEIFSHFLDWSYPYNALGILDRDTIDRHKTYIRTEIDRMLAAGTANLNACYYINNRLSNWGAGHFQNSDGSTFPILVDFNLARYTLASECIGEDIHFAIVKQLQPELLSLPFLNQTWVGNTREKARKLGVDVEPVRISHEKNFPWQFDFFRKHHKRMAASVLASSSPFLDWLDRASLETLATQGVGTFGSARIKMLFGTLMVTNILEATEPYTDRDFTAVTQATELRGNFVAAVFGDEFAMHEVSKDALTFRAELVYRLENDIPPAEAKDFSDYFAKFFNC